MTAEELKARGSWRASGRARATKTPEARATARLTPEARRAARRWGEGVVEHLLLGRSWSRNPDGSSGLYLPTPNEYVVNEGRAREAWGDLRAWLLRTWTHEHPGSRPWAWWLFDAPDGLEQPDPIPEWLSPVQHVHAGGLVTCQKVPEAFLDEREILEDAGLISASETRRLEEVARERGPVRDRHWWSFGPGSQLEGRACLSVEGDPPQVMVFSEDGAMATLVPQGEFLRREGLLSREELEFFFPNSKRGS